VNRKQPKHVPERSCIVCRRKKPKWELVRIVRTAEGGVEVDPRGKKAGRGAYLCRQEQCWELGLKKKRLEHALKVEIRSEQCDDLIAYVRALPGGVKKADM
jgi:predicted RNA-binding protein YlxR (DUF448 family)